MFGIREYTMDDAMEELELLRRSIRGYVAELKSVKKELKKFEQENKQLMRKLTTEQKACERLEDLYAKLEEEYFCLCAEYEALA